MLISPKHRFVFVHIPKCAGTSVRHQLRACDPDHIFLGRPGDHPVLGRIDYAHIPLAQLRAHFPEHYASLRDFEAFALVRDPLDRFGSALRQIMWQYEKRPMTLIPPEELRTQTLRMLDRIATEIDAPSHPYIFFARQSDYLFDQGAQIVDHVLPIALVPDLLDYFAHRTGVALDRDRRSNQNVELRFKRLGGLAYAANRTVRAILPAALHTRIKARALGLIAKKQTAAEASGILDLPEVQDFVTAHYAHDQQVFAAVMAQKDSLQAGLKAGRLAPQTLNPTLDRPGPEGAR
jgi:hypothetical protein